MYADGLCSWWATKQAETAREQCSLLDPSHTPSRVYSKNGRRARNDNFLVPEQSQTLKASSESKVSKGVIRIKRITVRLQLNKLMSYISAQL